MSRTVTAYARWIDRHRYRVLVASLVVAVLGAWFASQLSVEADLSYLLPPSAPSVRELRAIERRAQVLGTVMVAVEASDSPRSVLGGEIPPVADSDLGGREKRRLNLREEIILCRSGDADPHFFVRSR